MSKSVLPNQCEIGVVGLDASGRKLVRTLVDKRLTVAALDTNPENIQPLEALSSAGLVQVAATAPEFVELLRRSRTIVLSGGDRMDNPFSPMVEQMEEGDLLIDAANCNFKDCLRRGRQTTERKIRYLPLSDLQGDTEEHGSAWLAGGRPEIFYSLQPLLQTIARSTGVESTLNYIGPAASEHFVKMIHDGIHGTAAKLAQESAALLKTVLTQDRPPILPTFAATPARWSDETVRWMAQTARELGCPAPAMEAAAGVRVLTELEKQNDIALAAFRQPMGKFSNAHEHIVHELQSAEYTAALIAYAQGMAVLAAGSEEFGFNIDMAEMVRVWKSCGSRPLLDDVAPIVEATPDLSNLLHDDDFSETVMRGQERLRNAVWRAKKMPLPAPTLTAALDYLDSFRGAWLPVNLIQAPVIRRLPPAPAFI